MAKRFDITESPFGLCSDPNAKNAPDGSMSECSNMVKRRDGILQPRHGSVAVTLASLALTSVTRIIPVGDDALLIGPEGAVWKSAPSVLVADLDDTDIAFFDESVRLIEANGNYYINTTRGIRRFRNIGDEYVYQAGLRMDCNVTYSLQTGALSGGFMSDGNTVAYRTVLKRVDANGVITRSAPSTPWYAINDSGNPGYVLVTGSFVYLDDKYPETYDEELYLEVYRTKQTAIANGPGDTMYKVGESRFVEYYNPSPPYGFLYWIVLNYSDKTVADSDLGEYLYTSVSQQGLALQNIVPPAAHEVDLYNGSIFLGNCIPHPTTTIRKKNQFDDLSGESEGAGSRTATGDFTSGSDTITNVSDTTGVEIGQRVYAATYTDTTTYVESKTSTTIVMSKNALATNTGVSIDINDTITIQVDDVQHTYIQTNAWSFYKNSSYQLYDVVLYIPDHVSHDEDYYPDYNYMVFEPTHPLGDPILVWATHGEDYEPALSGPSLEGGVITYAEDDGYTDVSKSESNYVYQSKAFQPEHFTLSDQRSIGNSSKIDRLVNLRDVNLIFKRDGLFGMFGYNADSGWSTQTINNSVKILRPDAAVVVDDKVYAITETGFVIIDSAGTVTDLSRYLFHTNIKDALDALLNDATTETLGCWVAYDSKHQEVFFALSDVDYDYVDTLYVYNIITRSFTTWTVNQINHLARVADTSDTSLFIAGIYSNQATDIFWKQVESEYCRDRIINGLESFFVGDVDGTPMAILADNGETITTSDFVEYDDTLHEIEAVDSSTGSGVIEVPLEGMSTLVPYVVRVDEDYVWTISKLSSDYYVQKFERGTFEALANTSGITGTPWDITSDSSYVYWCDTNNKLYRWDGSGSAEELVTLSSAARGVAIYGSDIYYTRYNTGKICYRPKDGSGSESDLITGLTAPYALFIYGDDIYWSDGSPANAIKKRAISGGGVTTLDSGLAGVRSIHVDGTYAYYDDDTGDDTDLYCVAIGGGTPSKLATITDSDIRGISAAEDVSALFWTDVDNENVSMADFLNDYHKLTIDNVTGFDTYADDIDVYAIIDAVGTWLPKYGNTRALRKHFLAGSFIFSEAGDLSTYNRRLSDAVSYIEANVNDTTCRYMVPIAHARKIQLEPSIKISSAENANWELCGMTLEYTAQEPRGVKK